MTSISSYSVLFCTVLLIALIAVPVSGANVSANVTTAAQPYVSAEVSPAQATVGTPVTVSGVATGGNLTAGVQIWVFAGNYINVSTVPVTANGTFSKTYQTASLPPAVYYVIVQSPGNDGTQNIVLEKTGEYSAQVMNTKTGKMVFNFTGTGSVQDSAAAQALSDAFNLPGVDDVYTKCTLTLVAPETPTSVSTTSVPVATATTKKSPVLVSTILVGLGVAGVALARHSRR